MNRTIPLCGAVLTALSFTVLAQAPPQNPYYEPQAPQVYQSQPTYQQQPSYQSQSSNPASRTYGQQSPERPRLSSQELSNLVAPVALYPDLLLSQVLAASTYPLELVQAQQWLQANAGLHGADLVNAAKQQNWDPSVQALVAFPDVMNILTRDIQWTTELGNAFLAQQADVMDAIQQLRFSARNNGRLTDTAQQRVTVDQENGGSAIVIQPTDPQVVYPPVYNPAYVWGPPVYGAYPPLPYPAPGYGINFAVGTVLGVLFSGLLSFGGWGWGLSWLTHGLFLNSLFLSHFGFHGFGGSGYYAGRGYAAHVAWVHDPGHRLGIPYGNRNVAARFAGSYGGRNGSAFPSRSYGADQSGRSFNTGRSGYSGSSSEGGNRQMEAYRGLAARESRGYSYNGYGTGSRGGSSGYYSRPNYSGTTYEGARNSASASHGAYRDGYSGSNSSPGRGRSVSSVHYSEPRSSGRESSSHYAAAKSSGHFGGAGHSGGHSHSNGGGHSHAGSHRK
jgi:hypothetical protein